MRQSKTGENVSYAADSPVVLFISPHVDGYGADRSLLNNVIVMQRANIKVMFLIPQEGMITSYFREHDIPYIIHPFRMWTRGKGIWPVNMMKAMIRLGINFYYAKKIIRLLRGKAINIVHTNDLITPIGILVARQLKCRHVMHSRALHQEFGIRFDYGEKYTINLVDRHSDALICNSGAVYEKYAPEMRHAVPALINSAIFFSDLLSPKSYPDEKPMVDFLFVGRYEPAKDPFTAVKAARILIDQGFVNFRIHFFGKSNPYFPDYLGSITEYVRENGLNQYLLFNDFDKDIATKMRQYDVSLFCSPIEGIARVIVESMISGLPVIGTNSGSTPELVQEDKTGYLFEPKDSGILAEKMKIFISDRKRIKELGTNAFQSVGKNFSAEYTTQQILEVYRKALANR